MNEVKVKTTNADVFMDEYAPVFMWSPKDGLLWTIYDKTLDRWKFYKGLKQISISLFGSNFMSHYNLLQRYKGVRGEPGSFIMGRIKPNGKEIYIHDLKQFRGEMDMSDTIRKHFDKYVDKTVNAVYKYMKDYIK